MLLFNGDVEITAESIDWVVYGVKAMNFFYFIKIPRWLKENWYAGECDTCNDYEEFYLDIEDRSEV